MGLTSQNRRRREKAERQKLKELEEAELEEVEEQPIKHTLESLTSLDRSEQFELCKELGLKGYTTKKSKDIVNMILESI